MSNGSSGAEIDGNGSVQWTVKTKKDDSTKNETVPVGNGRKSAGADIDHGDFFKIDLIVPQTWTNEFKAQFNSAVIIGQRVTLYLPVEEVNQQISVHWSEGTQPPRQAGSTTN